MVPIFAFLLNLQGLRHYKSVSNLSQSREVGYLFLEHNKYQSSIRRTNLGCSLLPVIEAEILQVLSVLETEIAFTVILINEWVVSPMSIGSLPNICWRSPDFLDRISKLFYEFILIEVDNPSHNSDLTVLVLS